MKILDFLLGRRNEQAHAPEALAMAQIDMESEEDTREFKLVEVPEELFVLPRDLQNQLASEFLLQGLSMKLEKLLIPVGFYLGINRDAQSLSKLPSRFYLAYLHNPQACPDESLRKAIFASIAVIDSEFIAHQVKQYGTYTHIRLADLEPQLLEKCRETVYAHLEKTLKNIQTR